MRSMKLGKVGLMVSGLALLALGSPGCGSEDTGETAASTPVGVGGNGGGAGQGGAAAGGSSSTAGAGGAAASGGAGGSKAGASGQGGPGSSGAAGVSSGKSGAAGAPGGSSGTSGASGAGGGSSGKSGAAGQSGGSAGSAGAEASGAGGEPAGSGGSGAAGAGGEAGGANGGTGGAGGSSAAGGASGAGGTAPAPMCGNGVVETGEECDDGNASNNDNCLDTCKLATCGDGVVGPGEACDDGNQSNADACTNACQAPTCGDGLLSAGEQCDDSNGAKCDGCETCDRRRWLDLPAGASGQTSAPPVGMSSSGSATYELWARPEPGHFGHIFASFGPGNYQTHFSLGCENHKWYFFTNSASNQVNFIGASLALTCDDGNWHHVAGVRTISGGNVTITLYVDGVASGTNTAPVSYIYPPAPLYVGRTPAAVHTGTVHADEMRISSVARYSSAFTPVRRFASDASTVALYHLDDGVGAVLTDSSGNASNGTLTGTSWSVDTGYKAGYCVDGCVFDAECTDGNPCTLDSCQSPACAATNLADGTPTPGAVNAPADCKKPVCLSGVASFAASPSELPPDDGDPCTVPACNGSQPSTTPSAAGTPCGVGQICTGTGLCGVCLPGAKDCQGNTPRLCSSSGQWQSQSACGAGLSCENGLCVDCSVGITTLHKKAVSKASAAGSSAWNLGAEMSVEYWIKYNTPPVSPTRYNEMTVGTNNDTGVGNSWYCALNPGAGHLEISTRYATSTFNTPFSPAVGAWYHIACQFDGATGRLFVNGQLQKSQALTGPLAYVNGAPLTVTAWDGVYYNQNDGDYLVRELRIGKKSLYSASFTPSWSLSPTTGTVALYHANEGSGSVLLDATGTAPSLSLIPTSAFDWTSSGPHCP
jgi:cysteine-rich repeat protein